MGDTRLAIGVSDLVPRSALYPLLSLFFETTAHHATQVCISRESQATTLETLLTGRSDIVIGALERADSINGVRTRVLGELQLALVMPSTHPLARAGEPLSRQAILPYRTIRQHESLFDNVVELDSSNSIVVDDYASQVEAIRHGLGIGFVPYHLVRDDAEMGRLVIRVLHDAPLLRLTVAWRAADIGRSLQWMLEHLRDEAIVARLMPRIVRTPGIADLPFSAPIQPRVHDNGREVGKRVAAS
jgi:DNA-binding transcriptional LysR family regulator